MESKKENNTNRHALKSSERYYKEQRGKSHRYVKVSENIYDLDDLPVGAHLIVVHPNGGRSYRMRIDPDRAAVLAAIKQCQHAMEEAMRERNVWQPEQVKPYTKQEKKLIDELLAIRKGVPITLKGCTMFDIIEAGIKVLEANNG